MDIHALSNLELSAYAGRTPRRGFRFFAQFEDGQTRRFDIFEKANDPFGIPVIALADRPPFLTWPHVEADGVLCLAAEVDSFSLTDYPSVVTALVANACQLIESCINGELQADFRTEVHSYWGAGEAKNMPSVLGVSAPAGPSREIVVAKFVGYWLFGNTEEEVTRWIRNRTGESDKKVTCTRGLMLWLNQPPVPSEFPKTAKDAYNFIEFHAPELITTLEKYATDNPETRICVVVAAPTPNGPFVGTMTIPPPPLISKGKGRSVNSLRNGFKAGHMPRDTFLDRFFGVHPVWKSTVERTDAAWVHSRGSNASLDRLNACTVAVIGCGSLGSNIANLLAQSGVGKLILIDHDLVKAPNASRHVLGLDNLGVSKALALQKSLLMKLPHLTIDAVPYRFERLPAEALNKLMSATLIVSAMGATRSELALNAMIRARTSRPSVIYTWMEAYALAAHALLVGPTGPCFRCGLDANGGPLFRATMWPKGTTMIRQAGCGDFFQPYGAIELQHAATLAAELCIDTLLDGCHPAHFVRVGANKKLLSLGGQWTDAWLEETKNTDGGIFIQRQWNRARDCQEQHE